MSPGHPDPSRPCPVCGKPAHPENRPFCSRRCATIDLGRWLGEVYRVPGAEAPAEEDPSAAES